MYNWVKNRAIEEIIFGIIEIIHNPRVGIGYGERSDNY